MRSNPIVHSIVMVALSFALVAAGLPVGATTFSTDHSSLWWNPSESGWGMQLVQQADAMFATMFVYDAKNDPIWYTATLSPGGTNANGEHEFAGDLYLTRGPWFGQTPFEPAAVTYRKVGQLKFGSKTVEQASLSYVIDGTVVVKTIYRQTLRNEDFSGSHMGVVTRTDCNSPTCSASSMVMFSITQQPNQLVVEMPIHSQLGGGLTTCTFVGDYAQIGNFARSQGAFACTDGSNGMHTFEEMTVQKIGHEYPYHYLATARMTLRYSNGCVSKGYFFG
jgi:hypothetical protein